MRDGIGDNGVGYIEDPAIPVSSLQMVITSEPDLRYLDGLICVLSLLGECTDPIEPKVAAALAQATEPPLTRLITLHRAVTTGPHRPHPAVRHSPPPTTPVSSLQAPSRHLSRCSTQDHVRPHQPLPFRTFLKGEP